jgi:thioredoxin 1
MSDFLCVDDSNFESEVINSKVPVLVDFSAVWCGPCQRQLPVLEKFAAAKADSLKIVKVDIDESPGIASRFGIRSVPTLLLFNQGQKVDMKVGLTSLADLDRFVLAKTGA